MTTEYKALKNRHGQTIIVKAADYNAGRRFGQVSWYNVGIGQCGHFSFESPETMEAEAKAAYGDKVWSWKDASIKEVELFEIGA